MPIANPLKKAPTVNAVVENASGRLSYVLLRKRGTLYGLEDDLSRAWDISPDAVKPLGDGRWPAVLINEFSSTPLDPAQQWAGCIRPDPGLTDLVGRAATAAALSSLGRDQTKPLTAPLTKLVWALAVVTIVVTLNEGLSSTAGIAAGAFRNLSQLWSGVL